MYILSEIEEDLKRLKTLSIHNEQFKQECLALEIVMQDYEKCTSPSYLMNETIYNFELIDPDFNEEMLETYAFIYAMQLLEWQLNYYIKDTKAYFRDNYIRRFTYSMRMLTYYEHLYKGTLEHFEGGIKALAQRFPEVKESWTEDLYFFSEQFNPVTTMPKQTTTYDDTIVDIQSIMENDQARLFMFSELEEFDHKQFDDEYTSFEMAYNDFLAYLDPEYLREINQNPDEESRLLNGFNMALQSLEQQLAKYIIRYEPFVEPYIKKHTYAIRILSYYFSLYMKSDYQDIFESYKNLYPYAKTYWEQPLIFFGEQMHNLAPFKPRCPHCGHTYTHGVEVNHTVFCSDKCSTDAVWLSTQFDLLCQLSGFNQTELAKLLRENNMSLDQFTAKIDEITEVIDRGIAPTQALITSFNNASTYNTLYSNLKNYNVMRGNKKGFKGFVFEELHATNATINGTTTKVLGNNQLADFMVLDANGKLTYAQAKAGYKNSPIDFSKYEGQTLIVDKGNVELKRRAEKAGLQVIESPVTLGQSKKVADLMQLEKKVFEHVTGKPHVNAPITSAVVSVGDAAIKSARYGGLASAGYSIGNNTVELLYGEKTVSEAGVAIMKDTAIGTVSSVGVGIAVQTASIALQAVATTKAGIAIAGVASTASTALAGTAIGSSVLAGTAAVGTTLAASSAAISGVAATAIGSTLAVTTAGAAFVAGAPIVIGAAVIGGAVALGKRLLRGY